MTTTLTHTEAECITQIEAIDAEIATLRDTPDGSVGRQRVDLRAQQGRLERARSVWVQRLRRARLGTESLARPKWGG